MFGMLVCFLCLSTIPTCRLSSWRSCFSCRRCKCVERPAKGCNISFVAGGVQEQA